MERKCVLNGKEYAFSDKPAKAYTIEGSRVEKSKYYLIYCDYEDQRAIFSLLKGRKVLIKSIWNKPKYFICKVMGKNLPYVLPVLRWDYNLTEFRG